VQSPTEFLLNIYQLLLAHFGHRGWWPGNSQTEIIIGAVLTQAVSWNNVEKAMANLNDSNNLSFQRLLLINTEELAELIRPALYHRQKARKLKELAGFLDKCYQNDLDLMFAKPTNILRQELLGVWGIGPETADSILLYAGNKTIFVVDAYTKRIFFRLGLTREDISYEELQGFIHSHLEPKVALFNDFHAQIVELGKQYCKKKKPLCVKCPLTTCCKYSQSFAG